MKFLLLILKNLKRNKIRTVLTAMTVVILVATFCLVFTMVQFFDGFLRDKSRDVKLIITDRYRTPSRVDKGVVDLIVSPGTRVNKRLQEIPGFHSEKNTVWQFGVFTLDPDMKNPDLQFFAIGTEPEKIPFMTDDLQSLDPVILERIKRPPNSKLPNIGLLISGDRLALLKKKVGDTFMAKSVWHRNGETNLPFEMEFEVVGLLPPGSRWAGLGFMDYEYFNRVLKAQKNLDEGKVDLAWLMVDDQKSAGEVSKAIEAELPDIKCETESTANARFLEPFRPIFSGLKWILTPAIIVVMTVVVANAIGISVRERTKEIAVMKVLGFSRPRILFLVLGEAVLVGILGGLIGGGITQALIRAAGGIPMGPGSPPVFISPDAWWWGPGLGIITAVVASALPAWGACRVKVSEVFAKVA